MNAALAAVAALGLIRDFTTLIVTVCPSNHHKSEDHTAVPFIGTTRDFNETVASVLHGAGESHLLLRPSTTNLLCEAFASEHPVLVYTGKQDIKLIMPTATGVALAEASGSWLVALDKLSQTIAQILGDFQKAAPDGSFRPLVLVDVTALVIESPADLASTEDYNELSEAMAREAGLVDPYAGTEGTAAAVAAASTIEQVGS